MHVHLSSVSLCSFPSVEPVPGFSQAMSFETAPVINAISSQRKKCVQGVLHIGDILAFSSLAALLMRRCGFVAGDTSFHLVLCFLLLFFMSPVLCQYIYFDVNPFVTSSDFCLGITTFYFFSWGYNICVNRSFKMVYKKPACQQVAGQRGLAVVSFYKNC